MSGKKYKATIVMNFTCGQTEDHDAQRHFHNHMSKVFPLTVIDDQIWDIGGKLIAEKIWEEQNFEYSLRLQLHSVKSLSNLFSMCSIFQHWSLIYDGSFRVESIQEN